jgi:radical SAM superfamily enzyme YgiQ (UPF0313 family)
MNETTIQLFSFTSNKHPVLPYVCSVLQKMTDLNLSEDKNKQVKYLPYIWHTAKEPLESQLSKLITSNKEIHIFGFSLYAWSIQRSIKAAKICKKAYPNAIIIAGGPAVAETVETQELWAYKDLGLEDVFDIFVHGPGEEAWLSIINKVVDRDYDFTEIPNLSIKIGSKSIWTKNYKSKKTPVYELDAYFNNSNMDKALQECDDLGIRKIGIWETNRGCPYHCAFCTWGLYTKQKVSPINEASLKKEIDWIVENLDEVNIADANFGILPRDVDLTDYIIKKRKEVENPRLQQIFISHSKNNKDRNFIITEKLMRENLIQGELVGIQTLESDAITASKRDNIELNDLWDHVQKLNDKNLPWYADLIYGMPGQTKETFLESIGQILDLNPMDIRGHRLALIANADFYSLEYRKKFGLKTTKWKIFDGDTEDESEYLEVVKETNLISKKEMKEIQHILNVMIIAHLMKLTVYIAKFLQKEYKINYHLFYTTLYEYATADRNKFDKLSAFVDESSFDIYNDGLKARLSDKGTLFGISNTVAKGRFRKQNYMWLYFMFFKADIFSAIKEIILHKWPQINEKTLSSIIEYQDSILIDFDYNSQDKLIKKFNFNWKDYFNNENLIEGKYIFEFYSKSINGKQIVGGNPESYINVSGDFHLYPNKALYFTHRHVNQRILIHNNEDLIQNHLSNSPQYETHF